MKRDDRGYLVSEVHDKLDCGCGLRTNHHELSGSDGEEEIVFCPLHASAPRLLKVCRDVLEWLEMEDRIRNGTHIRLLREVIVEAGGEVIRLS